MPRSRHIPKFRIHKATQQAYVEVQGRRIYLGRHDKPETQDAYDRLVAEWLDNGRRLPPDTSSITVTELCARFYAHAERYYVKGDGTPTSELHNFKVALRALRALYGPAKVTDFGPRRLRAVRETLVNGTAPGARGPGSRTTINQHIRRIKQVAIQPHVSRQVRSGLDVWVAPRGEGVMSEGRGVLASDPRPTVGTSTTLPLSTLWLDLNAALEPGIRRSRPSHPVECSKSC